MQRKIAVEEHYALPPVKAAGNNAFREDYLADVQRRLSNREARIEEMDANGIEYTPVSLTEPGIQGILNPREAVDMAKRCNDHVYEYCMQAGLSEALRWTRLGCTAESQSRRCRT